MTKGKSLTFLLVFLIFFSLGKTIWERRDYYRQPFDFERASSLYGISQYVREKDAAWIADEILFAYAGWNYINGGNPILVNPENPPLGKYLIGFSIKFFNNEKIPTLVFVLLSLYSFYLLSKMFLGGKWPALLPVAIFSWEKLFKEQLIYLPLIEVFALAFLNLSFLFFLKGEKKSRWFLLANLFLGCLWATRPWMATVPLVGSWVVYLLLVKKSLRSFLHWVALLPVALFILLLSYFRLFLEGWSLYKVLSVQKWILWYHQSRLINFGTLWPYIYLKRWYVWWGDQPYLPIVQWNIFWPIFTTLALIFSVAVLLKVFGLKTKWFKDFKFDKRITVLCLWVVFYLAFLSIGNISSRYVFYLLPFCYLLGIYFFALAIKAGRAVLRRLAFWSPTKKNSCFFGQFLLIT